VKYRKRLLQREEQPMVQPTSFGTVVALKNLANTSLYCLQPIIRFQGFVQQEVEH